MQALHLALLHQPVLMVLDDVSQPAAAACRPLLSAARHQESLVLALSREPGAFAQLCSGQHTAFTVAAMTEVAQLALQPAEARALLRQRVRHSPQLGTLPDQTAIADKAAAAYVPGSRPVQVPQVMVAYGQQQRRAHLQQAVAQQASLLSNPWSWTPDRQGASQPSFTRDMPGVLMQWDGLDREWAIAASRLVICIGPDGRPAKLGSVGPPKLKRLCSLHNSD